jgi:hypothetical protein
VCVQGHTQLGTLLIVSGLQFARESMLLGCLSMQHELGGKCATGHERAAVPTLCDDGVHRMIGL